MGFECLCPWEPAWHMACTESLMWNGMCIVHPQECHLPLQYLHAQLDMGPCRQVCAFSQMLHKLAGKPLSFMRVRVNELIAKLFSHEVNSGHLLYLTSSVCLCSCIKDGEQGISRKVFCDNWRKFHSLSS